MKIKKQKISLPIKNFDFDVKKKIKHSFLFPNELRALFVGPSNVGKSNCLLAALINPNGLKFENVYLFSKTLHQPKYLLLEKILKLVRGVNFITSNHVNLTPKDIKRNSVCIFDDLIQNQNLVQEFFSMGRHFGICSIFICQTYSLIFKQNFRDNANFLVLFKMDDRNMKHVFADHVCGDMTFDEFKSICRECWSVPHGFLTISKENQKNCGRYRKNFDSFITWS